MSEMRLIVAGAGGRMGRALTRVISQTEGAVLAGALEAPGSELLGKDSGVLAGLPANGVELSADRTTRARAYHRNHRAVVFG
jgi:4-hydroxy-tetrahydrodipicolinate reductase